MIIISHKVFALLNYIDYLTVLYLHMSAGACWSQSERLPGGVVTDSCDPSYIFSVNWTHVPYNSNQFLWFLSQVSFSKYYILLNL